MHVKPHVSKYSLIIKLRQRHQRIRLPNLPSLRERFPEYQNRFRNELKRWHLQTLAKSDNEGVISIEEVAAVLTQKEKWSHLLRAWRSHPRAYVDCIISELSRRDSFQEMLDTYTELRIIVRELRPDLLQPIHPESHKADFHELLWHIKHSVFLKKHISRYIVRIIPEPPCVIYNLATFKVLTHLREPFCDHVAQKRRWSN